MRSFVLILATILLLGGAFVGYTWMSSGGPREQQTDRASLATHAQINPADPDQIVGASVGVWINSYDERAELKSRLRYAESHPRADGLVELDKPEAEFFLDGGRILRIEGQRGSVVMRQAGDTPAQTLSGGGKGAEPQPPSRGQLHDVVIALYESPADRERRAAALTVEMNNAAFDNDTFRITTDAYTDPATGRHVPADQVPVKVRSTDYDFDGRGLVVRWNERDRRLQLLEIAHGERLTVKNPSALRTPLGRNGAAAARRAVPGVMLASADPAAAAEAAAGRDDAAATRPTTTPATRRTGRRAPTLYRATFDRDLRISEGNADLASGDVMQADFLVGADGPGLLTPTTTAPVAIAADAAPTTLPASPDTLPGPATAPADAAVSVDVAPTSSPAAATPPPIGPIVIRWTGKLRVAPLESEPVAPLEPGDAAVRLAGAPLTLAYNGADVACAAMTYRTADGGATFEASDAVAAVTLKDALGSVVQTPRLDYTPASGTAVLLGRSRATITVAREGQTDETLTAEWTEQCALRLMADGAGGTTIEHADLAGSVRVRHPQVDLDAATVALAFAAARRASPATLPATTASDRDQTSVELQRMTAAGDVRCVVREPVAAGVAAAAAPAQSIAAQNLDVETARAADGQLYPRVIRADGAVRAEGDGQTLSAGHLTAVIGPTTRPTDPSQTRAATRPAIDLESLAATGGVKLAGRDGAFAEGDDVQAVRAAGRTEATLRGSPARVGDATNTIDGPVIRFLPEDGVAEVVGPGALHGLQPAGGDGAAPRPVDIAWAGGARVDANADAIDFREEVTLTTTDPDGTRTTATADALRVGLASDAGTRPATAPATGPAAPRAGGLSLAGLSRSDGGGGGAGLLSGKSPRSATLDGNMKIESALLGPDGSVLRRAYLTAASASYDVASKRVDVPGAGQMLVEDYRAADPANPGAEPALAGNRGATAFKWSKSLAYDATGRAATMEGEVFVNHKPVGQGQPFQIHTHRVRAELEEPPTEATGPATRPAAAGAITTQPATGPAGPAGLDSVGDGLRLERITAEGGVRVESDRLKFRATDLTYSPSDDTLVARGTENDPVTFTDERGGSEGAVRELRWNTKTDRITLSKFRGQVR